MQMQVIGKYLERMNQEGVNRGIIVVQHGMTAYSKQIVTSMQQKFNKYLEYFEESEVGHRDILAATCIYVS